MEQKLESGHQEEMAEIKATSSGIEQIRLELAREKGVKPEVLAPLFENLGMTGLTSDQMREKAKEAVKAILERANQKIEPSTEGADIDKTITASRAKLAGLDTAGAQAILDKKIAEEEARRQQRLIPLLAEKAAIARLSYDYPSAKTTLEELLRFDPDRVWSWIDLGDIWMTTGSLDEAAKAFRAAGDAARRTRNERDLSVSDERIGDVQKAQGDLPGALKTYQDGRAIRERLAKSDPGNAQWQRDLSVSYAKLADVYRGSNEMAQAREALADGRAIIGKLVEEHPDWAMWKQGLAWFDAQIPELKRVSPKSKQDQSSPQEKPRRR